MHCTKATTAETAKVAELYEASQKLDKSSIRDFLTELNKCPEKVLGPYDLNSGRRNHSKDCYTNTNGCASEMVLLTRLYPHYGNLRKFHKSLAHMQFINSMIHDLDAALKYGDISYLLLLLAYQPPRTTQTVYNVKANSDLKIVNEDTLFEEYGKHYEKFLRDCNNLPKNPCISCDRLITDQKTRKIKKTWKHFNNAAYTRLFDYMNSDDRIRRGGQVVSSLEDEMVCVDCCLALNQNKIPFRSIANSLDVGVVPEVISSLTPFESIFIRLAICYQTIVKLAPSGAGVPYNQRMQSLKGFAVHLPAPVSETINQLHVENPKTLINPEEFIVLYGLPKKDKTVWRHLVNVHKIHKALIWLKENNPLYADVIIPDEPEQLLPGDDTVDDPEPVQHTVKNSSGKGISSSSLASNGCRSAEETDFPNVRLDTEEMIPVLEEQISDSDCGNRNARTSSSGETSSESMAHPVRKHIEAMSESDVQNYIEHYSVTGLDNLEDNGDFDNLYQLLRLDETPIPSENKRKDALCFPDVYPYNSGGKGQQREKIQEHYFEELRLMSRHGHIRRNIPYLFSLGQDHERRCIKQGVFASIKNVKGMLNETGSKSFTQMLKDNNPAVQRRLSRSAAKIPNTAQYWLSQKGKLRAMTETLGAPCWFITLNPAEYNWSDLIRYIRFCNSDLAGVEKLLDSELLSRDPVLVSNAIRQRFRALLSFILETEVLGGKVTHHYVRKEYQNRGTCHFHCFFWVDGAPVIGRDSDEEVIKFILKCVTCRLPDKALEPEMHELVTGVQTHKCQAYCLRLIKVGGRMQFVCRFGFPRNTTTRFLLSDVLNCIVGRLQNKMKKRLYDLVRAEPERNINDYCPTLLYLWKGNMDIQFVSEDSYSIVEYLTKYITKKESPNLETYIDNESRSAFQKTIRFTYACLRKREMSAHEVVDRILQDGGEMFICSEKFEFVSTAPPARRTRVLRNLKDIERNDLSGVQSFYPDLIHNFYPGRPNTDCFDQMSLYDFVLKYHKIDIKQGKKKGNAVPIKQGSQIIAYYEQRAPKDIPVIQHHNFDIVKEPELYYYSLLILYKPWRIESDIRGDSSSHEEEFFRIIDEFPAMKRKHETRSNIRKKRNSVESSARNQIANTKDGGDDDVINDVDEDHAIAQCLQDFEEMNKQSKIKTEAELLARVQMLNADQRCVYDTITQHLSHVLDHSVGEKKCIKPNCEKVEPLFLFVSGPGGTGKTFLLEAIVGYMYVETHVRDRVCNSILCAPSGLAANNIGGSTIHSIFKVPVEKGCNAKYSPLPKRTRDEMKAVMGNMRCVIVDEISMVSNILLFLIHSRLGEIYDPIAPFGGVKSVIVFGDLLQLPPVNENPTFVTISGERVGKLTGGIKADTNLWSDFKFAELTINQRQSGGKNAEWRDILQRIRLGIPSIEDSAKISARCIPIPADKLTPSDKLNALVEYFERLTNQGQHPTCLLPTCEMVELFNLTVLRKNFSNHIEITAYDTLDYKLARNKKLAEDAVSKLDRLDDPRQTGGLEKSIRLCENVRVMLRTNLDVKEGLVNGSMGTVISLVHCPSTNQVLQVNIKFDAKEGICPIKRVRRRVNLFPGAWLHREMFPICLSYSLTIHRCQGLTLRCVMADLGEKIFGPSQSYVALSRVTALDGLHLINFSPKKVVANNAGLSEYFRLGSKPYGDFTREDLETMKTKAEGQVSSLPSKIPERVWYKTKNRKTAEKMVSDLARQSSSGKITSKEKAQRNRPKSTAEETKSSQKTNSKILERARESSIQVLAREPSTSEEIPNHSHANDRYVDINQLSTKEDSLLKIKKLVRDLPHHRQILSLIDMKEKFEPLFDTVILPFAKKDARDDILGNLANQLHPDPFGHANINPTQKWLTSDLMDMYGYRLKDTDVDSIYYAGSMARNLYITDKKTYIRGHIFGTHALEHYSIHPKDDYEHSITNGLRYAGDPATKAHIIMFCNDGGIHWYLLAVDMGKRKVFHYDSGAYVQGDVSDRCTFIIQFVNDLRQEVFNNPEYSSIRWDTDIPALNPKQFGFEDAKSVRQPNGFDCGVYAMINAESYLQNGDHSIFEGNSMPFMRMVCMSQLREFIRNSNHPE